ncbi:hypothetical protein H4R18_001517 [Coemansia javaensis]|uniref:Alpha/beta hydrolase fold-3 domain-containing protein n=1 Tax=Coemansia javaensis TaxID=2761396 RepID=A0A9W8LJ29_9FUNG|nr:hypothetical protein H4R18_001517 [Coemansia javaensis]
MSAYFSVAKHMLRYLVFGKTLPGWDMRMQVMVDAARDNTHHRFPRSSDDDLDAIDYAQLHRDLQQHPLPATELAPGVGARSTRHIPTDDTGLSPDALAGMGFVGDMFRDVATADKGAGRMLPFEIVAPWTCCERSGVAARDDPRLLEPAPLCDGERILLTLHGGYYVMGGPASHRMVIGEVAKATGMRAFVVDYRLAPLHPFPAQLHDALLAFYHLVGLGYAPRNIVLLGDSAGGHLCVDLLLALRHIRQTTTGPDAGMPGAAVLLSPLTTLTLSGASLSKNKQFDYIFPIPVEWPTSPIRMFFKPGQRCTQAYREQLAHPLLALERADLSGLPPVLIQSGDKEVLIDDIREFAARLAEQNPGPGAVVNEEYQNMVHVFHRFVHRPESVRAIAALAEFLSKIE